MVALTGAISQFIKFPNSLMSQPALSVNEVDISVAQLALKEKRCVSVAE